MKIWYLKFPIHKFYDGDMKAEAVKAKAKIIDARFQGDNKSSEDCPIAKGDESKAEPKKRKTRKSKEVIVEEITED